MFPRKLKNRYIGWYSLEYLNIISIFEVFQNQMTNDKRSFCIVYQMKVISATKYDNANIIRYQNLDCKNFCGYTHS